MSDGLDELFAATQERTRAYKLAFGSPAGQAVLHDLVSFCCAVLTTAPPKPPIDKDWMTLMEGRRQVFLLIQRMTGLTTAQVFELSFGHRIELAKEDSDAA